MDVALDLQAPHFDLAIDDFDDDVNDFCVALDRPPNALENFFRRYAGMLSDSVKDGLLDHAEERAPVGEADALHDALPATWAAIVFFLLGHP